MNLFNQNYHIQVCMCRLSKNKKKVCMRKLQLEKKKKK